MESRGPELKILVTGGTSGIGGQIVRDLAARGAVVYFTGRKSDRGREQELYLESRGARGKFLAADLTHQGGVADLARRVAQETSHLDVLVNNVGGVFRTRTLNDDGVELTMALNYLHPLLLSGFLFPLLQASGGRIVNLTSGYHLLVRLTEADLTGGRWDSGMNVYGRAKLLAFLTGEALSPTWKQRGVALHFADPFMAFTPQTRTMSLDFFPWYGRWLVPLIRWIQRRNSLKWCASSAVDLALSPRFGHRTGAYCFPGGRVIPRPWNGRNDLRGRRLLEKTIGWILPEHRSKVPEELFRC